MKNFFYTCLLFLASAFFMACSVEDASFVEKTGNQLYIKAVCKEMSDLAVKSDISKNPAETRINQLYLFFFDTSGHYLESKNTQLFTPYKKLGQGETAYYVPKDAIEGQTLAIIYAVANVEPEMFYDNNNDGIPDDFEDESGSGGKTGLEKLREYTYAPLEYNSELRNVTSLPVNGMPMVGESVPMDISQDSGSAQVELIPLMSRIDVTVQLASEQSDQSGTLPKLSMLEWFVGNIPTTVKFTEPEYTEELGDNKDTVTVQNFEEIYNNNGTISITFYMYENKRKWAIDPDTYDYPDIGVDFSEDDKQRWKPLLADPENSTFFRIHANYSTYNDESGNATYDAYFTFYLGDNHTDDFTVIRNHHYMNNITIKGLTKVGNNPEHISFDARVDVSTNNPYYIMILREREHDAHFNVTPMDVYLFEGGTMTVTIEDASDKSWIRMEKVPNEDMSKGTMNGIHEPDNTSSKYLTTGTSYSAGNGKRRYFTTTLMDDLKDNTTYDLQHRDRVYFYIDENISTKDRTATINLNYKTAAGRVYERSFLIVQHGLLKVDVYEDNNKKEDYVQTIYVEAYEEYLNHYDPLDEHNDQNVVYEGLEWGLNKVYLNERVFDWVYWDYLYTKGDWHNVYVNGREATMHILEKAGNQYVCNLNEKPESAAEYCYNKNKREDDGRVASDKMKWFLPGIRQLEAILTTYYNQYTEFQNNYYWSSSAGKEQVWGPGNVVDFYPEDNQFARATKALEEPIRDGDDLLWYAPSDWDNAYTSNTGIGGKAPRVGTYLRIRAAYMPAEGEVVE